MTDTRGGAVVFEVDPEKLLKAAQECQDVSDKYGEIVALCESRDLPRRGAPPIAQVVITVLGEVIQKFLSKGREGQEQFAELSDRMTEAARRYQEIDEESAGGYDQVGDDGEDSGGSGGSGGSEDSGGTGGSEDDSGDEGGAEDEGGTGEEDGTEDEDGTGDEDGTEDEGGTGDEDDSELEEENQQLEEENQQLEEENQRLEEENQRLEEENRRLEEEQAQIARRDHLLGQVDVVRGHIRNVDDDNESWERRIRRSGIEDAYNAYLVDRGLPPADSLWDQMQALEDRIEIYYDRLDSLDGIDPHTTDPAQIDGLQALIGDEGSAIHEEYERIKREVEYAEQFLSARDFWDGDDDNNGWRGRR